jgi:hypothetical protein
MCAFRAVSLGYIAPAQPTVTYRDDFNGDAGSSYWTFLGTLFLGSGCLHASSVLLRTVGASLRDDRNFCATASGSSSHLSFVAGGVCNYYGYYTYVERWGSLCVAEAVLRHRRLCCVNQPAELEYWIADHRSVFRIVQVLSVNFSNSHLFQRQHVHLSVRDLKMCDCFYVLLCARADGSAYRVCAGPACSPPLAALYFFAPP